MKRIFAEISESAIVRNLELLRHQAGGARVCAVVKADAYGHGAITVASVCEAHGVDFFAVATVEEGISLRSEGIKSPILILGYTPVSEAAYIAEYGLTQALISREYSEALSARCMRLGITVSAHIKIDTGMHRLGFDPDEIDAIFDVCKHPCYKIEGIFSHFSTSDEPQDATFTALQEKKLISVFEGLRDRGVVIPIKHIANSAAILNGGHTLDMVRAGIALYGYGDEGLVPVMTVKSHIASLHCVKRGERVGYSSLYVAERDSIIATVPAGYADGVRRDLGERGATLLVGGKEARVFGRVCMDYLMLDVTDCPGVFVGDEVVLFGNINGHTAADLGASLGTIAHEILTGLSTRVERILVP